MKAIILHHRNGMSHVALWVEDEFDTAKWLADRKHAVRLLDVVKIEEQFFHSEDGE